MAASSEDDFRRAPVPRRMPPKPRPTPGEWDAVYQQTGERLACERLYTTFLNRLDTLTQRQDTVLAACAYLEEQDLTARLATLEEQRSQLAGEYEKDLLAVGDSLPEDERSSWLGKFRAACADRAETLQKEAGALLEIIQRRDTIEYAHAERAGIQQVAGPPEATTRGAGDGVALGMIHGMAVMARRTDSTGTTTGLVAAIATAAQALAAVQRMGPGSELAITVPVSVAADGGFWLDLAMTTADRGAPRNGTPRCALLGQGLQPNPGVSYPLIYLADLQGSDRHGDHRPDEAPEDRARAGFGRDNDGAVPPLGLVIRGPATLVTRGRRVLDADVLTSFARSIIFSAVYDGTSQTAARAMRAAQALEVVALMDPAINGGVWADVNPCRQIATAALLIEGCAGSGLRFLHS